MASDYVGDAREAALDAIANDFAHSLDNSASKCGSPIEQAFFYALVAQAFETDLGILDMAWGSQGAFRCEVRGNEPVCVQERDREPVRHQATIIRNCEYADVMTIWPQCHVGKARVDFLLMVKGPSDTRAWLAVECDGHDFHEKTKEQARRDKARDRALQSAGLPIFRFAGSEIYAGAAKCADACLKFLHDAMIRGLVEAEERFYADRARQQALPPPAPIGER